MLLIYDCDYAALRRRSAAQLIFFDAHMAVRYASCRLFTPARYGKAR